MPRIARDQIIATGTPQETLAEKVKAGKAVPLISNVVDHDLLLQGHQALVQDYVKRIEYPAHLYDLAHITQVQRHAFFHGFLCDAQGVSGSYQEPVMRHC